MTDAEKKAYYTTLAIAAAILYVGYKYAPNQAIKAMSLGVAGVLVSKHIPYLKEVA